MSDILFESIKRALSGQDRGGDPYDLGYDAGLNGPNTENCSFSIFRSQESTRRWEQGNKAGLKAKASKVAESSQDNQG